MGYHAALRVPAGGPARPARLTVPRGPAPIPPVPAGHERVFLSHGSRWAEGKAHLPDGYGGAECARGKFMFGEQRDMRTIELDGPDGPERCRRCWPN